jgi:hypothetical protein
MHWLFYIGMPALTHDESVMYLDPNLFLLKADSKRSGGACLSPSYTGDWLFSELHHLAILSDSIKPWPMTLAPTNETIRRETMRKKKTQRVNKKSTMIWEYQG